MSREPKTIERKTATATPGSSPRGTVESARSTSRPASPAPRERPEGPRWSYGPRGQALYRSWRQLLARPWASLTTLLALGIVLALPALLLFSFSALNTLAGRTIETESLTLYLNPSIDDLEGAALARELDARPEIAQTRYISRDEALATFQQNSDVGAALDLLGANPLPGAVVVFPALDRDDDALISSLAQRLAELPTVERVQVDLN